MVLPHVWSQMQEELERGQTFEAPAVNVLHEAAEVPRVHSTYVQGRLAGEPRSGPPTNKPAHLEQDESVHSIAGNSSSYHTASTASGSTAEDPSHSLPHAQVPASVMFKPNQGGGFNAATFGANSGIKPLNSNSLAMQSQLDSPTALPTAASTADGNPATSSAIDPLASMLGESEFSVGNLGVGFQSSVASALPSDSAVGAKKSTFGNNSTTYNTHTNSNHNNAGASGFHNYSIDEEKSYAGNANLGGSKPAGGALSTFDSYLSSADNRLARMAEVPHHRQHEWLKFFVVVWSAGNAWNPQC